VGESLNSLGSLYLALERFEDSRTVLTEALGIARKAYGDKVCVCVCVCVCECAHTIALSAFTLLRSLTLAKHLDVGRIQFNIGLANLSLGDCAAARVSLERALAIYNDTLGPVHSATLDASRKVSITPIPLWFSHVVFYMGEGGGW
jgi:tetratricopeptide (TPR) repeat protein